MGVIRFLRDFTGLFNWDDDLYPTTEQAYQNAVINWTETERNLVDAVLWQPATEYALGNIVKTPSLPSQCVLVCTVAGMSGGEEPDYTNVSTGDDVTDGTITWKVAEAITSNGGTMTGNVLFGSDAFIQYQSNGFTSNNNLAQFQLGWGSPETEGGSEWWLNGAKLSLHKYDANDSEHCDGAFNLVATNDVVDDGHMLCGYPDGRLLWDWCDISPQTGSGVYPSAKSVSSGTVTAITNIAITKGTWLITYMASFASNSSGYRNARLSVSSATGGGFNRFAETHAQAVSGSATQTIGTVIYGTSSSKTVYLNVQQNSGSTLNVTAGIHVFRLSDKV